MRRQHACLTVLSALAILVAASPVVAQPAGSGEPAEPRDPETEQNPAPDEVQQGGPEEAVADREAADRRLGITLIVVSALLIIAGFIGARWVRHRYEP